MQVFQTALQGASVLQPDTLGEPVVLGNSLVLNLDNFPELRWLLSYCAVLHSLQAECDRLSADIQAIQQEGEVYQAQWIEPYTKTKNGKQYTYYQLRWLTGEYKTSGQPKIMTKHLSNHAVEDARAAIDRGRQLTALEQERQRINTQIAQLKHRVLGMEKRLECVISQNSLIPVLHHAKSKTSL